ncbi:hypothetical protein [Streptomyces antibioticus]|uniref:hypothetical protein n=1 Tax=Streptomyces antibioticus TaxID=1890 RepID=UPI0033B6B709
MNRETGVRAASARASEAFLRLSDHCLRDCAECRANRRESCDEAWELHRIWSRARKEARQ